MNWKNIFFYPLNYLQCSSMWNIFFILSLLLLSKFYETLLHRLLAECTGIHTNPINYEFDLWINFWYLREISITTKPLKSKLITTSFQVSSFNILIFSRDSSRATSEREWGGRELIHFLCTWWWKYFKYHLNRITGDKSSGLVEKNLSNHSPFNRWPHSVCKIASRRMD